MKTSAGYVPYGRKPDKIPNRLWDHHAGRGDPECKDCGGNILLTDVEGHYSGQCQHCRDRYQRYIAQVGYEKEPNGHSAKTGRDTLKDMLERDEGREETIWRARLTKRGKEREKRARGGLNEKMEV